MKKKTFWICLCLLCCCYSYGKETTCFVDASSTSAREDGSRKHPFKTFEAAIRAVALQGDKQHTRIIIRQGTYYFQQGISIGESLSGLTISAYPGEEVVFSGGVPIPPRLVKKQTIGNCEVSSVNLKEAGITDWGEIHSAGFSRPSQPSWGELFVNGLPMRLSRWPNGGMIRMGKIIDPGSVPRNGEMDNRGAIMEYDSLRISSWHFTDNIWIGGYFNYGYADDWLRVAKLDKKEKTIHTDGATLYGFRSGNDWNKWYAFNIKEETDEAGEYYLDREEGTLYFIPPAQEIKSLCFSMLEEPFLDLWKAHDVTIKHITFECSRGLMLSLMETENVRIEHCTFRNAGNWAISVGLGIEPFEEYLHEGTGKPVRGKIGSLQQHLYANQTFNRKGGSRNRISHCTFYNLGAGGVSLGGGDRMSLQPGENEVSGCLFHDNNRIERSYRPAIHITGAGNCIRNCEIYNTPSMAILLHGNNHLIENNYIHDVCLEIEDQGAVYYGRNPSECGTVLRNNLFACIPGKYTTCAVYHDDGACGMLVEGNIFYHAGKYAALIGGGSDNCYRNNLFINGQFAIHADNRLQNWNKALIAPGGLFEHRLNEVHYTDEPYRTDYPFMADYLPSDSLPKRNVVENNLFIGIEKLSDNPQWLIFRNNKSDDALTEIRPFDKERLFQIIREKKYFPEECLKRIGICDE